MVPGEEPQGGSGHKGQALPSCVPDVTPSTQQDRNATLPTRYTEGKTQPSAERQSSSSSSAHSRVSHTAPNINSKLALKAPFCRGQGDRVKTKGGNALRPGSRTCPRMGPQVSGKRGASNPKAQTPHVVHSSTSKPTLPPVSAPQG